MATRAEGCRDVSPGMSPRSGEGHDLAESEGAGVRRAASAVRSLRDGSLAHWSQALHTQERAAGVLLGTLALLTALRPFRILKPTARTAHAASLLLRAPQGKEKAGLLLSAGNGSHCY